MYEHFIIFCKSVDVDHIQCQFTISNHIYCAEVAEKLAAKSTKVKKNAKKLDLPAGEADTQGAVMVFDIKGGYLDEFGTQNELEEYVEKVGKLGDYPVLSSLMELYAMEEQQEPEPLIEECERLLASSSADAVLKEKTGILLDAAKDAQDAQEERSTLMLYFDPEV